MIEAHLVLARFLAGRLSHHRLLHFLARSARERRRLFGERRLLVGSIFNRVRCGNEGIIDRVLRQQVRNDRRSRLDAQRGRPLIAHRLQVAEISDAPRRTIEKLHNSTKVRTSGPETSSNASIQTA